MRNILSEGGVYIRWSLRFQGNEKTWAKVFLIDVILYDIVQN